MKRRGSMLLLGSAMTAWPFAARAQPKAMPVIGHLSSGASRYFAYDTLRSLISLTASSLNSVSLSSSSVASPPRTASGSVAW